MKIIYLFIYLVAIASLRKVRADDTATMQQLWVDLLNPPQWVGAMCNWGGVTCQVGNIVTAMYV
jgi:hypothetical protein